MIRKHEKVNDSLNEKKKKNKKNGSQQTMKIHVGHGHKMIPVALASR